MQELACALDPCPLEIRTVTGCREAGGGIGRHGTADVIFTDVQLPDGDWKRVLQMARHSPSPAEVIVVSRFVDVPLYLDALEEGVFDFVVPPLRTVEIGYIATATAVTDSTAIRLDKAVMAKLLRTEPKFSEYFLSYLLMRNVSVQEDVISLTFDSTEKRLARALLLLARASERQALPAVVPRVTHETLAQMIGATRAQVSALMSQFRKKGYIHYDDELRVNESLVDFVLK